MRLQSGVDSVGLVGPGSFSLGLFSCSCAGLGSLFSSTGLAIDTSPSTQYIHAVKADKLIAPAIFTSWLAPFWSTNPPRTTTASARRYSCSAAPQALSAANSAPGTCSTCHSREANRSRRTKLLSLRWRVRQGPSGASSSWIPDRLSPQISNWPSSTRALCSRMFRMTCSDSPIVSAST